MKDYINKKIYAEKGVYRKKMEDYSLSHSEAEYEIASLFKTSAEDEEKHAEMLKGALDFLNWKHLLKICRLFHIILFIKNMRKGGRYDSKSWKGSTGF